MQWRTRLKRLTASEKHEVINDIFGGETEYNKFYDAVSVVYRIAEFIFLAAALLFAVIYIAVNSDEIQYAQFEYMAQNFARTLNQNTDKRTYLTYEREEDQKFTPYGGGLAVCGYKGVTLYSATGVKTAYIRHGLVDPIPVASDRYLMIYENGGNEYKLYSLYSEMYAGKSEYSIYGAFMGKDGSYALITSGGDGACCVLLYNKNFKLINKYTKYGSVVSAAISDDGAKILIITVGVDGNGGYSSELMLCTAGSESVDRIITLSGALPLDCRFVSDSFVVLCDKKVCFFNSAGSLISENTFDGSFDFADLSDDCAVLVFCNSRGVGGFTASLFDGSGNKVYSGDFSGTPLALSSSDGSGFILTGSGVVRISPDSEPEYTEVDGISAGDRIRAINSREAYLCTPSHAIVVNFK